MKRQVLTNKPAEDWWKKKDRYLTCTYFFLNVIMNLENQNLCLNLSQRVRISDISEVGGKLKGFKVTITFDEWVKKLQTSYLQEQYPALIFTFLNIIFHNNMHFKSFDYEYKFFLFRLTDGWTYCYMTLSITIIFFHYIVFLLFDFYKFVHYLTNHSVHIPDRVFVELGSI